MNYMKTPYKKGDIIRIDCRPFGEPFNAMVLEDEHQYDSCFPTILFRIPYTDEWSVAPLKSGRFYKDIECNVFWVPLSALYRLSLTEDDELYEYQNNGKKRN